MIAAFLGFMFVVSGLILYYVTVLFPTFRTVYLDWFALFLIAMAWVYTLYRVMKANVYKNVDSTPKYKHLIEYLRRDNKDIECYGERIYSGESFLDIPGLGLLEYLGKDCYYSRGDKKFVWALENLNYTPDPRYGNFTHILWNLGFNNSNDVKNVLLGRDMELLAKVYCNMENWDKDHGASKLLNTLESYKGKTISFKPKFWDNIKERIGK